MQNEIREILKRYPCFLLRRLFLHLNLQSLFFMDLSKDELISELLKEGDPIVLLIWCVNNPPIGE